MTLSGYNVVMGPKLAASGPGPVVLASCLKSSHLRPV